jgi:hypothetical protein
VISGKEKSLWHPPTSFFPVKYHQPAYFLGNMGIAIIQPDRFFIEDA